MLGQHSHEACKHKELAWKTNVGYTIAASDGDHCAVKSWFVRFFGSTADVSGDVAGNEWSRLFSIFNHLWNRTGFAFRNKEDVVPYNVDVLMVNTFQMFIGYDAFAPLLLDFKAADDFGAFHTGSPDNGFGVNDILLAESHTAFAYFGDFGTGHDFNLQLAQAGFSFLNKLIRQDRQNLRSHIGNNEPYFGWINEEFSAQLFALLGHFPNQLDTSETGTDDDEGQHCAADGRVLFFGSLGVHIADLAFERNRVIVGPEREGVFFCSGNSEECWFASCADYQVIISIGCLVGFQLLVFEINIADFIQNNIHFQTGENFLQINLD
ncbi:hypothetical protein D3C73_734890 [compost metagenome]